MRSGGGRSEVASLAGLCDNLARLGAVNGRVRPPRPQSSRSVLSVGPKMRESRSPRSSQKRSDSNFKRAENCSAAGSAVACRL